MNWALVAACTLALPLVCMFPEKYGRTDIDVKVDVDDDVTIDVKSKATNTSDSSETERDNNSRIPEQSERHYSPYDL